MVNDVIVSCLWLGFECGYVNVWMDMFYDDDDGEIVV